MKIILFGAWVKLKPRNEEGKEEPSKNLPGAQRVAW